MNETTEDRVARVRRFNRFYTGRIGVLEERLLRSPFSLTEARVIYELARLRTTSATTLGDELGLDAGYLSRILRGFRERGLIERRASPDDGRRILLSLTDAGREAFARLDAASADEVRTLLTDLSPPERERLVGAMDEIEELLDPRAPRLELVRPHDGVVLRPPRAGDLGWVVHRHGVLYAEEYGWDERFEALVAEIMATFVRTFDPARERCWIAERNGKILGSVFLVRVSDEVARLRCLLVEPDARGLGIGTRLVDACVGFARNSGYRRIVLWTNSVLVDARRLYERAGFRKVHEEPNRDFGKEEVAETWELELAGR
ncbi:MAG TPA: helix-turn-helix domain-containing GNAT family N-acetyltransferase [Gemmatimonadota bacterium]|nr:helix-turn-helix domain-containing GNAT family N-acetyltransferase [Gemmatimonadota bacterium]